MQVKLRTIAGSSIDTQRCTTVLIDNNDVVISLKALMGETSVAIADPKVGEAISKLLDAASAAQIAYNADSGNAKDLRLQAFILAASYWTLLIEDSVAIAFLINPLRLFS